jgi:hypothetical protein
VKETGVDGHNHIRLLTNHLEYRYVGLGTFCDDPARRVSRRTFLRTWIGRSFSTISRHL